MRVRLLIFTLFSSVFCASRDEKEIACYYSSWKVYTTCKIEDIDPNSCTLLYYAFAGIQTNGTITVFDINADIYKKGYIKFNGLKKKNPKLRTLLAIGGGKEGSRTFSRLAESATSRWNFIKSALDFMQRYGFDGIDIDWEFPTLLGGRPQDKDNFPKLLREVRGVFDEHGYILTVAVGASESIVRKAYNVPEISSAVHYINLMLYNMHSYRDGVTGANSPLYSDDTLNVQYCVNTWISNGAAPGKILLGIGAYGKSYTLVDSTVNGIGASTSGPGLPGPVSKTPGILTYTEILEKEKLGWTKQWSEQQQIPYLYYGNQWIGYDDAESVEIKVNFAKQNKLGGLMVWSIDMDDPRGRFGPSYPLLNDIKKNL